MIWTKEKLTPLFLSYDFKKDIKKDYRGAVKAAQRLGLWNELTSHMSNPLKLWDKNKVLKKAKDFKTRIEFQEKAKGAYWFAQQNNLLNEACSHMEEKFSWDKESAMKVAKNFNTKKEFRKKERGAYNYLSRNGLLNKACSHIQKRFTWNIELATEIANKYSKRGEFRRKDKGCYQWSSSQGILEKICNHMEVGEITLFEENAKKIFEKSLFKELHRLKIKYKFHKEFRLSTNNHRIDYLLYLEEYDLYLGIEYKSGQRYWNKSEIEDQRLFYQKRLNSLYKNKVETYLVSDNGKYGWSNEEFIKILKNLLAKEELLLYN